MSGWWYIDFLKVPTVHVHIYLSMCHLNFEPWKVEVVRLLQTLKPLQRHMRPKEIRSVSRRVGEL